MPSSRRRSPRTSSRRLGLASTSSSLTIAGPDQVPLPPSAALDAAPTTGKRACPETRQAESSGQGGRLLRSRSIQIHGSSSAQHDASSLSKAGPLPAPRRIKLTLNSLSPSVEPDALVIISSSQPFVSDPAEASASAKGKHQATRAPEMKKTPKVAHWRELSPPKPWKGGLFTALPAELLDMIISIDMELDLRDHLALASTCRSIRRCYTDVVWQVLFESFRQDSVLRPNMQYATQEILIESEPLHGAPPGRAQSYIMPARIDRPIHELVGRPWNVARHIVSSAGSTGHGHLWDAWDSTALDRLHKLNERRAMQDSLRRELDLKGVPLEPTSSWTLEPLLMDHNMVFEVDMRPEEATLRLIEMPEWQRDEVLQAWSDHRKQAADPWRSAWRLIVSMAVNTPMINKTQAKAVFRVSDRELLALKSFPAESWLPANIIRYRLAAVQALAYRSHGGPIGHAAYVARLDAKAADRRAAKIASGVIRPPEPARLTEALLAHDWEDWTEDGML